MAAFQGYSATKAQVEELFTILSIMRPHESGMEAKFINRFIAPLEPVRDECGNFWVRIGTAPVLWSCHIDTVHSYGGINPVKMNDDGLIKIHPKSLANCLGADDGSGVWLMLQMIRAKRPGLYIFHRGEECGGIGSRYIAKHYAKRLEGIEAAIAFDRKDTGSIITHQWGGRCCSEDFSASLSKAIGLDMKSDSTGSFTDTASYTDLIGECTNVSVGYKWQHGKSEEQDLPFLLGLLDRMLDVDVKDLVYKRRPGEKEKKAGFWKGGGWGGSDDDYVGGSYGANTGSKYYGDPRLKYEQGKTWSVEEQGYLWPIASGKVWDDGQKKWVMAEKGVRAYMDTNNRWKVGRLNPANKIIEPDTHLRLIKDYPEEIAKLLADKQYGLAYLHDQIKKNGGVLVTAYLPAEETKTHDKSPHVCPACHRLNRFCAC